MKHHGNQLGLGALERFATSFRADYRFGPLNMVFEGLKQKGSMIIVPSTAVETMGLGAMGGLTAFDRILGEQNNKPAVEPEATTDATAPAAPETDGQTDRK